MDGRGGGSIFSAVPTSALVSEALLPSSSFPHSNAHAHSSSRPDREVHKGDVELMVDLLPEEALLSHAGGGQ